MRVGVPREIKNNESRVAITPAGVYEFSLHGHEVFVETSAGVGSGISDEMYVGAGAKILDSADEVWATAELLLKVKEPIGPEYGRMREGQMLFTYLHLAANEACTDALVASGTTAIAYESVELPNGSLPLLAPMSEVAGRLATQVGAYHLMKPLGGEGILMGGISGVPEAKVVVIGGGVAGENAASMAMGLHAEVNVLDVSPQRLQQLDARYNGRIRTRRSSMYEIAEQVQNADLVIGSVLVPGARAPKLVTNEYVKTMKPGGVFVDIAIDQGGCFEDSHPTTHDDPTFRVHEAVFYCVANMPGAVPVTSTRALTNATMPYAVALADKGWRDAMRADRALALGLNVHAGKIYERPVAETFGREVASLAAVLG